jgi:hypothetical protein
MYTGGKKLEYLYCPSFASLCFSVGVVRMDGGKLQQHTIFEAKAKFAFFVFSEKYYYFPKKSHKRK